MDKAKTYKLHVKGMHCKACTILIEENLKGVEGVVSVQVNLALNEVEISGDLGDDLAQISEKLTEFIKERGYFLSVEKEQRHWGEFTTAIPIALAFIAVFLLLQKAGFVNLLSSSSLSYETAFLVGLIASVSTCLAIVGGLVLSLSATFAKENNPWKAPILFHVGRLLAFFILGGLIGLLGSSFQLGITSNFLLNLLVALIMLILGINLLDVLPATRRVQFTLPKFFAKHTLKASTATTTYAPFLVGVGTFFLPCGFTQSMQLYTLTTTNFLAGGLTMLSFALGTLPVLGFLSFASFSIAHKAWKGVFFKTAGLIVVALALFNLYNALIITGIIG